MQLHTALQQFKPDCEDVTNKGLTKAKLRVICKLASTQKDSILIKYAACAASCKSAKETKDVFGFQDFHTKICGIDFLHYLSLIECYSLYFVLIVDNLTFSDEAVKAKSSLINFIAMLSRNQIQTFTIV